MLVRWTEPAVRDLTNICHYTEGHEGSDAARRVALRIYEGLGSLTQFPRRGRLGRSPGTRELVFAGLPFLAVHRVGDDFVEIVRILHGAQRWP
jgi:toxin ParE1/3/4